MYLPPSLVKNKAYLLDSLQQITNKLDNSTDFTICCGDFNLDPRESAEAGLTVGLCQLGYELAGSGENTHRRRMIDLIYGREANVQQYLEHVVPIPDKLVHRVEYRL